MSTDHRHAPDGHGGHGHGAGAHDYALPELPEAVDIFDTTLRDGSQQEGLSLTVDDKLRVAEQLDHLGVTYIEGGWPGANPKDDEFFARAPTELHLATSTLVAFGSTRRAGVRAQDDAVLREAGLGGHRRWCAWWPRAGTATSPTPCGPRWTRRWPWWPTRWPTCASTASGSSSTPSTSSTATATTPTSPCGCWPRPRRPGPRRSCCATPTAGTLPDDIGAAVAGVRERTGAQLGIHCHNDAGCAVANSLVAVQAGATQVQGCINGYGERAGNADLSAAIPNLSLKLNVRTIPPDRLERLTPVSHHIAELVNIAPNPQQPYVGASVFAHKGGLHASAVARRRDLYEHVPPDLVGNGTRVVVSEMAGRSTLAMKAAELGLELDGEVVGRVLDELKRLEHEGYHFEVADGSLELLLRRAGGWEPDYFEVESFRVITDHGSRSAGLADGGPSEGAVAATTEATVKVHVGTSPDGGHGRGQRAGQRPRRGAAPGHRAPLPGPGRRAPHRLPGAGPRHRPGDRGGDPGAGGHHRRGADLDHHRGLGEHHRGQLAGPLRLDRLRPAPRRHAGLTPRSGQLLVGTAPTMSVTWTPTPGSDPTKPASPKAKIPPSAPMSQ